MLIYLQTCSFGLPRTKYQEEINMLQLPLLMSSPTIMDMNTLFSIEMKRCNKSRLAVVELDDETFIPMGFSPICMN